MGEMGEKKIKVVMVTDSAFKAMGEAKALTAGSGIHFYAVTLSNLGGSGWGVAYYI